jgi:hypothetical protein
MHGVSLSLMWNAFVQVDCTGAPVRADVGRHGDRC